MQWEKCIHFPCFNFNKMLFKQFKEFRLESMHIFSPFFLTWASAQYKTITWTEVGNRVFSPTARFSSGNPMPGSNFSLRKLNLNDLFNLLDILSPYNNKISIFKPFHWRFPTHVYANRKSVFYINYIKVARSPTPDCLS